MQTLKSEVHNHWNILSKNVVDSPSWQFLNPDGMFFLKAQTEVYGLDAEITRRNSVVCAMQEAQTRCAFMLSNLGILCILLKETLAFI